MFQGETQSRSLFVSGRSRFALAVRVSRSNRLWARLVGKSIPRTSAIHCSNFFCPEREFHNMHGNARLFFSSWAAVCENNLNIFQLEFFIYLPKLLLNSTRQIKKSWNRHSRPLFETEEKQPEEPAIKRSFFRGGRIKERLITGYNPSCFTWRTLSSILLDSFRSSTSKSSVCCR